MITTKMYESFPAQLCEEQETWMALTQISKVATLVFITARCDRMKNITRRQISRLFQDSANVANAPIVMCNGGSKSKFSSELLSSLGDFDTIVFIDDSLHHVHDMSGAFDKGILGDGTGNLVSVWYVHENDRVAQFNKTSKDLIHEEYTKWSQNK